MNFYFVIRILSLITMIIGSFLVTFSVWAIYVRYCSLYHTILQVNPRFFDYFSPQYYDCNSTEWSEWSSCNQKEITSKRFRKNAACKRIEDSKPCACPLDGICDDITVRVNNNMTMDCLNSVRMLNFSEPFLIRGSNNTGDLCSVNNT